MPDFMLKLAVLLLLMLLLCVRLLLLHPIETIRITYAAPSNSAVSRVPCCPFEFCQPQLWTYHPLHIHTVLITHIISKAVPAAA